MTDVGLWLALGGNQKQKVLRERRGLAPSEAPEEPFGPILSQVLVAAAAAALLGSQSHSDFCLCCLVTHYVCKETFIFFSPANCHIYAFICVCVRTCCSRCEVRGQREEIRFSFIWVRRQNAGPRVWWQAPLPVEPRQWPMSLVSQT